MTVIFYDKNVATYKRVENVEQVQAGYVSGKGRQVKAWCCCKLDGKEECFKMIRYDLERVEM